MKKLFPPHLNIGSKDLGPNGPVRRLQQALLDQRPGLGALFGLEIDGNYGKITGNLVAGYQQDAVKSGIGKEDETNFRVDGHFGPLTREYVPWDIAGIADLPFVEGGECMYVSPDSPEPILWEGGDDTELSDKRIRATTEGSELIGIMD